jgi:hypothetical protein
MYAGCGVIDRVAVTFLWAKRPELNIKEIERKKNIELIL